MNLRRHLRACAAISLVLQSVWLFALVPRDCCTAHRPAAESCHEEVTPPPHCPMRDDTGAACPMHRADQSHPVPDDCSMRGSCGGPMSALFTLLSAQAVLSESPAALARPLAAAALTESREQLLTRFIPPDSPPPRA